MRGCAGVRAGEREAETRLQVRLQARLHGRVLRFYKRDYKRGFRLEAGSDIAVASVITLPTVAQVLGRNVNRRSAFARSRVLQNDGCSVICSAICSAICSVICTVICSVIGGVIRSAVAHCNHRWSEKQMQMREPNESVEKTFALGLLEVCSRFARALDRILSLICACLSSLGVSRRTNRRNL